MGEGGVGGRGDLFYFFKPGISDSRGCEDARVVNLVLCEFILQCFFIHVEFCRLFGFPFLVSSRPVVSLFRRTSPGHTNSWSQPKLSQSETTLRLIADSAAESLWRRDAGRTHVSALFLHCVCLVNTPADRPVLLL